MKWISYDPIRMKGKALFQLAGAFVFSVITAGFLFYLLRVGFSPFTRFEAALTFGGGLVALALLGIGVTNYREALTIEREMMLRKTMKRRPSGERRDRIRPVIS